MIRIRAVNINALIVFESVLLNVGRVESKVQRTTGTVTSSIKSRE